MKGADHTAVNFQQARTLKLLKSHLLYSSRQEVQHGHPYGNSVLDLVQDQGLVGIRDVGSDLHAPVDRTRMQDGDFFAKAVEDLLVQAEEHHILA